MATKLFDICAITGKYSDTNGNPKNRYLNVGGLYRADDGHNFIRLNAHFNSAGIPRKDGSDSIILPLFKAKDKDTDNGYSSNQDNQNRSSGNQAFDTDIPF